MSKSDWDISSVEEEEEAFLLRDMRRGAQVSCFLLIVLTYPYIP